MTDDHQKVTDALERLLRTASGDTGGSRRAAEFLLGLWNGAQFKADLQELLYTDKPQFEDMQTVMRELHTTKDQLDTYVTEEQMKPVIEAWGEVFSGAAS